MEGLMIKYKMIPAEASLPPESFTNNTKQEKKLFLANNKTDEK